jgi:hypothetical protein
MGINTLQAPNIKAAKIHVGKDGRRPGPSPGPRAEKRAGSGNRGSAKGQFRILNLRSVLLPRGSSMDWIKIMNDECPRFPLARAAPGATFNRMLGSPV